MIDDDEETLARDPVTGIPIRFLHVAQGGNSDGSFEDPYRLLTNALTDSRYLEGNIDVIYVHGRFQQTVTHHGGFTIVDGTQLLSTGPLQTIDTQYGPRTVPFSGADRRLLGLPIIQGQVGLGAGTTLSGFEVRTGEAGATDDVAILAEGVQDFDINHNVVFSGLENARHILVRNVTGGTGRVEGNRAIGDKTQRAGLTVTDSNIDLDIVGNEFSGHAEYGIVIVDSVVQGDIKDNRIDKNDVAGVSIQASSPTAQSRFEGDIEGNALSLNELRGIEFIETDFMGDVKQNVIDGTFSVGDPSPNTTVSRIFDPTLPPPNIPDDIPTDDSGTQKPTLGIRLEGGSFVGNIDDNTVDNNGFGGILIRDADFTGNLRRNSTSDNGADGIAFQNSALTGNIENNTATGNKFGGILVNDTPMTGNVVGNTSSRNGDQGVLISNDRFTGDVLNNTFEENSRDGLVVDTGQFTGNVANNTVRGNGTNSNIALSRTGIQLYATNFTGDIADNSISDHAQGRALVVGSDFFTGSIARNTFVSNRFDGIYIFSDAAVSDFNGDIENNVIAGVQNGAGDAGIFARGQTFNGNIRRNSVDVRRLGIWLIFDSFDGEIIDNLVTRGVNAGLAVEANTFQGAVRRNEIQNIIGTGSTTNGILLGKISKSASFTGSISENTVIDAADRGISLFAADFSGGIYNNVVNNNRETGLLVRVDNMTGNVMGNTANANGSVGIRYAGKGTVVFDPNTFMEIEVPPDNLAFTGDISANTTHRNQVGLSMDFSANVSATVDAGITSNVAEDNQRQGFLLDTGFNLGGTAQIDADFMDNRYRGNHLGDTDPSTVGNEFRFVNSRPAAINVTLDGNVSLNSSPALDNPAIAPFNFDFLNQGSGSFTVAEANNTGTVGSGDGSVTIP